LFEKKSMKEDRKITLTKKQLFKVFRMGFKASNGGWNGDDDSVSVEESNEWLREEYEKCLKVLRRQNERPRMQVYTYSCKNNRLV